MSNASTGGPRRDIPHGLMFHRFHPEPVADEWQGALTPKELERLLLVVGIDRVLSPTAWLEKMASGGLAPSDVCITFDDGLRSQMDLAMPVLEKHGLKAFWFVYSSVFEGGLVRGEIYSWVAGRCGGMEPFILDLLEQVTPEMKADLTSREFDRYKRRMNEIAAVYSDTDISYRFLRNETRHRAEFDALADSVVRDRGFTLEQAAAELWMGNADIKRLSDQGHEIGLHSYDHPYDLAAMSKPEQRDQYARNAEHIALVTGKRPHTVSHPLNSYNGDTLAVLSEMEIVCGFRANMFPAPSGSVNPSSLELAREDAANLVPYLQ